MLGYTPLIPTLDKQRQVGLYEFDWPSLQSELCVSLDCIVRLYPEQQQQQKTVYIYTHIHMSTSQNFFLRHSVIMKLGWPWTHRYQSASGIKGMCHHSCPKSSLGKKIWMNFYFNIYFAAIFYCCCWLFFFWDRPHKRLHAGTKGVHRHTWSIFCVLTTLAPAVPRAATKILHTIYYT